MNDFNFPKTQIISFPRSGSTVFTNIILENFKNQIKFDGFGELLPKSSPNLLRSHNITQKIQDKIKYVILYRHPIRCIISYYYKSYGKKYNKQIFFNFINDQIKRWNQFTEYWVLTYSFKKNRPNLFVIYYDDFIRNTESVFTNLSNFLFRSQIKFKGIEKIQSRDRIWERLKYWNISSQLLDEKQKLCENKINQLKLKDWKNSE